ncbi:hypothetical protein PV325_008735 [Microctonus aethiopoides]|uniref:Uncharacterized protein n=1 Tax=Microctonus aethiopoides TaxID=144406 RepID=A0AA39C360_9HYME|nr:hypothetical protein PV325_008735 [Microctonus aethiopoides]KAK0075579.1 hypothetical protein PV326_011458 [Microctonus aethiopoides]KAK0157075.1 hypothetical protein PV328_011924 [Microctonus aethiopoides]
MEAERWPKICLREEVRNILNRKPTVWDMTLLGVARDMGIEKVFEDMWNGADVEAIRRTIEGGLRKLAKDYDDENERRISVSTCNAWYKDLDADDLGAKYWEDKGMVGKAREIWCRLRCRNVGRSGKKGVIDENCRMCKKERKSLIHILECARIAVNINQTLVRAISKKVGDGSEAEKEERLKNSLRVMWIYVNS